MTTLAVARLVLFWGGLMIAVAKLVSKAYDAGRRRAIARIRARPATPLPPHVPLSPPPSHLLYPNNTISASI